MSEARTEKLKLPHKELELLVGLNEYTSHADELVDILLETERVPNEPSDTK